MCIELPWYFLQVVALAERYQSFTQSFDHPRLALLIDVELRIALASGERSITSEAEVLPFPTSTQDT